MKTTTLFTNCLTYEELSAYTTYKMDSTQRAKLYQHITTCELCTCAVNGFSVIPFAPLDINDLNDKIDMKTHVKQTSFITFAQACIVIVSILAIVGFYALTDAIQKGGRAEKATSKVIPFSNLNIKKEVSNTMDETPVAAISTPAIPKAKKFKTDFSLSTAIAYQESEKMSNDWSCQPFKMK